MWSLNRFFSLLFSSRGCGKFVDSCDVGLLQRLMRCFLIMRLIHSSTVMFFLLSGIFFKKVFFCVMVEKEGNKEDGKIQSM